jgi:hypothetical protein
VDDLVLCRGHNCCTPLIDIESRRPVDVLTDRTAQALGDWLRPILPWRDRLPCPGPAPTPRAPATVPERGADGRSVARLEQPLAGAVERAVARYQSSLTAAVTVETDSDTSPGARLLRTASPVHTTTTGPATCWAG